MTQIPFPKVEAQPSLGTASFLLMGAAVIYNMGGTSLLMGVRTSSGAAAVWNGPDGTEG